MLLKFNPMFEIPRMAALAHHSKPVTFVHLTDSRHSPWAKPIRVQQFDSQIERLCHETTRAGDFHSLSRDFTRRDMTKICQTPLGQHFTVRLHQLTLRCPPCILALWHMDRK